MKDNRGSLWFGNSDGTLTLYDGATGQFRLRSLQDKGRVNVAAVWALYMDADRCLWIGTNNGVWKLNTKSGGSQKISIEKAFKDSTKVHVRAIVGTKDGAIWLGTSNIGVCKLKLDSEGEMSIKIGYEKVANIKNSSVRSLLVSSDGNVYVGYMDGFAILSPKTDAIREYYTTRDGLCSNFIGCLVEDHRGHIWLGSNSGVSRYSRHQHLFYNYYISGSNRSALLADKTLFFGNNKSLTYLIRIM